MEKTKFVLDLKKLGAAISAMRVERKLTQEVLSTICNVDVRTIQRIEKGNQNLTIEIFFAISSGLEIAPDELIKHAIQN